MQATARRNGQNNRAGNFAECLAMAASEVFGMAE
jgi:hypothetical protein